MMQHIKNVRCGMQNLNKSRKTSKAKRGFLPVSTSIRKSVRFFIINIFLVKDFKLSKLKSGKWIGQSVSILSE